MPAQGPYRVYATLKRTPDLLDHYNPLRLNSISNFTRRLLERQPNLSPLLAKEITAVSAPSLDWQPRIVGLDDTASFTPDELIVAYRFASEDAAREFVDFVIAHQGVPLDANGTTFLDIGSDPGGEATDHWCPGLTSTAAFGHRADARRTIGADVLTQHLPQPLAGQGVNVVVIDQGLDAAMIPAQNWGGGFGPNAGTAPPTSHGMATARGILDLAPDAVLYDVPLIPPKITDVRAFASDAQAALHTLLITIAHRRKHARWSGPWVLVNAWAIFDTRTDILPPGSYTENKAFGGHPLINRFTNAVQAYHLDVIFGAGNCGQFCPSRRCGPLDRGPGHGIWGANAHPLVITAGAVRTDETWLGYSSQGPGPVALATQKPDFCAPSHFAETDNAAVVNSGTSAACAITAGAVAALRSNPGWDQVTVSPAALKAALIATARKTHGPAWDNRFGNGILDLRPAVAGLSAAFSAAKKKRKRPAGRA